MKRIVLVIVFIFTAGVSLAAEKKEFSFIPYRGESLIRIHPAVRLGELGREEFARYRAKLVGDHRPLGIFPTGYYPFNPPHDRIYGGIRFGKDWTDFSSFYVCNPYCLVILSTAARAVAFEEQCGLTEIRYSRGTIEELYRGDQARKFFDFANLEPTRQRAVRLWMVNAQDAGFAYGMVDRAQCENIDFTWNNTPDNIANAVYSGGVVYRLDGDGKNSISPDSSRATLRIQEMNVPTRIYVKLWKNMPAGLNVKEDLAYVIRVEP